MCMRGQSVCTYNAEAVLALDQHMLNTKSCRSLNLAERVGFEKTPTGAGAQCLCVGAAPPGLP